MKSKNKKILSGITAIVCALTLLLAGTFAWQALTNVVNPFSNSRGPETGANLHDDFNMATGDKDVYVENTGNNPIFVRIKLQEFLDTTTHIAPTTMAIEDWETHIPGTDVEDCDEGYHDAFADAFEWTMGNTATRNYNSIVGTTKWNTAEAVGREELDKLVADAHGDAVMANMANKVDTKASTTKIGGIPVCEVISMAAYNAKSPAEKRSFVGWVYDTDGYAYWSQQLPAGEATGLLLDSVSLPGDETYYYAINVIMEYVDLLDLPAWIDDTVAIKEGSNKNQTTIEATDEAKDLLSAISENWARGKVVGDRFSASGWDWIVIAVDGAGNALVTTDTVIGTIAFNSDTGAAPNSSVYIGSTLDLALRSFYAGLENYDQKLKDNRITEVAQASDFAIKNPPNAFRGTDEGLSEVVASGGIKTCFALSWREANDYLVRIGDPAARPDYCAALEPDHRKIPAGFGNNFSYHPNHGGNQLYWTRTERDSGLVNAVTQDDSIGGSVGYVGRTDIGVRPALWISVE